MIDKEWTSFKVTGDYNTDIRSLYQAWATPEGLEKWFLRRADFFKFPAASVSPMNLF